MGDPGSGAEDQASRRGRRLAELRAEQARGEAVDEALLERLRANQRAWNAGADGERQVAQTLTHLQRYGWVALHDVHWPGRPRANIDHIAVGPGGIVVVDAKNWTGQVTVRDGVLRQNGYRRDEQTDGVAAATGAIAALLEPSHRTATRGMVCLTAQEQEPVALPSGVVVVGRSWLPEALASLPPRLSPYEVADIARYLADRLDTAGHGTGGSVAQQRGPAGADRPRSTPAKARTKARAATAGGPERAHSRGRRAVSALLRAAFTCAAAMAAFQIAVHLLASVSAGQP